MIRNEREFDEQKFLQDFSELPFNLICSTDNIDDKLDLVNSLFTTCPDRQNALLVKEGQSYTSSCTMVEIRRHPPQGSKLKKSSVRLMATNWRNIVARCKFLLASLYNVYDTAHSMARSRRY